MPAHMEPLAECICFLVAYFLPSIVALLQGKRIRNILIVNLLFGWTVLGWVVAMAMAVADKNR